MPQTQTTPPTQKSTQSSANAHPVTYPFSEHVFMFPFSWNAISSEKDLEEKEFSQRTQLNAFKDALSGVWQSDIGKIRSADEYNDRAYFYPFTHDFIFGNTGPGTDSPMTQTFTYPVQDLSYVIQVDKEGEQSGKTPPATYRLGVKSVTLTAFDTGVAILSFSLTNTAYPELKDVLAINDYGRRLFPQFLGDSGTLAPTRNAFLAKSICLQKTTGEQQNSEVVEGTLEDFRFYEDLTNVFPKGALTVKIPAFIHYFLGASFVSTPREDAPQILIAPVLDDRMFVVCWYGNDALALALGKSETDQAGNWTYAYETSEDWNQYVHIDNSGISSSGGRWLANENRLRTYDRWAGYGTLYGVTRYSFVCLTNRSDFVTKTVKIPVHVVTRYAEMVRVALTQRATFLRFESEASRIASLRKENAKKLVQIRDLYQCYVEFINRGYFSTSGVTAQEQGIELFKMISREVEVEADLKYLREDLAELHTLADLESKQSVDKLTQKITFLTALVLIPSFLVSYLQYGFKIPQIEDVNLEWWVIALISLVTMVYLPLNTERIKEIITKAHFKANWVYYLSFLIIGLLLLLPLIYQKLFSTHAAPATDKKEVVVPVPKKMLHKPESKDTLTLKPR